MHRAGILPDYVKKGFSRICEFSRGLCCVFLVLTAISGPAPLQAQPDYNVMTNWAAHPDKLINPLAEYNLDVAVFDAEMQIDSVIEFPNRAVENTGTDVFFVHPTYLSETYAAPGNVPLSAQPAVDILTGIIAQAGLLAKYGRFYAPRYRQATPPVFLGTPEPAAQAAALGKAYGDVRAAFLHYLAHENGGNDFILAAHSQGAYLLSMLLQEVIAADEALKSQMIAAIPAGMISVYDTSGPDPGAWWDGLSLCTEPAQCGCVMTWRAFGESLNPGINPGHPALSPLVADSGWTERMMDPESDRIFQDSLYYGNEMQPLRFYIAPNGGDSYGSGTGFVAFDSLYSIRHRRTGPLAVGFEAMYNPQPGDQRPNDLASEAADPLFDFWGYHRKDYHLYLWALTQQLDAKLAGCTSLNTSRPTLVTPADLEVFPNPAGNRVNLLSQGRPLSRCAVVIYSLSGKVVMRGQTSDRGGIELSGLSAGFYLLKSEKGCAKFTVQ